MDLLDRLLGHDAWTTSRLLGLAATLSDEQLDQEFDIAHRTVRRTFEHIVWNIECWTDLMKGGGVRSRPTPNQSIAALSLRHTAASSEFLRLAREVADLHRLDDTFVDVLDDPPREKSFGGVIIHLATHGMHHRAQLAIIIPFHWESATMIERVGETPAPALTVRWSGPNNGVYLFAVALVALLARCWRLVRAVVETTSNQTSV